MTNSSDAEHCKESPKRIIVPRPYQTEIISKIEQTVSTNGKLLISLAVGTGRTAIIGLSIDSLFQKNIIRRAIVVTPNSELSQQFLYFFNQMSLFPSTKMGSNSEMDFVKNKMPHFSVIITTISMFKKMSDFPKAFFDVIFFDDCHHLTQRDWSIGTHIGRSIIGFTPLHPIEISKKLLCYFGKETPDYSYGISALRLRQLADIRIGATYRSKELLNSGLWKFVRPRDIRDVGRLEASTFVSERFAEKNVKSALRLGDIVLQNIFSFGKMAIVTERDLPAIASQNLFIIRSKSIPPMVLFEYLRSKTIADAFRQHLEESSKGTVVKRVSLRDVGEIPVPLPYSEKQLYEFANAKRTNDIETINKAIDDLALLKQAYLESSKDE